MRKILFRGKRLSDGEWIEGYMLCSDERTFIALAPECLSSLDMFKSYSFMGFHEVDTSTVGQYTGMTDKNGEWIFEGDVVRLPAIYGSGYATVEFCETAFKAIRESFAYRISGNMEIVGNIYDNPDLIKSAADYADNDTLMPAT